MSLVNFLLDFADNPSMSCFKQILFCFITAISLSGCIGTPSSSVSPTSSDPGSSGFQSGHYKFTLSTPSKVSAGVYQTDGTLVRTLFNGISLDAGTYDRTWDGKLDDGTNATGTGYNVKVLSNNVKYEWEGVIGNTSDAKTGIFLDC